ncbi:MAG: hypothetical protein NZL93_06000 [Chthoniobacterales bacterium]|nr:hypothetical protein [Chthoniobacterales bacterium]
MLRPEDWAGMYARSDFGVYFPPADATRLPRYLYMMVLSVGYGGLLTSLYSAKGSLEEGVKRFLRVWGGRVGGVFLILGLFIGLWAWQQQPVEVRNGVWGVGIVPYAVVVWALGLLMGVVASIWISLTPASWGYGKAYLAGAASVMGAGGYVILRDMVRDVTLMLKGFDVWQRVVNPNWYVIGLFFVSLLVGVGLLVWLYFILRSARPSIEKYV